MARAGLSRPGFRQFFRFCVIGVVNTTVNYLVFYLCLELLSIHYTLAGGAGFLSGGVVGFFFNRSWTFQSSVSASRGLSIYMAIMGFSLICHSGVQWLAVQAGVAEVYSQLFGIAVTTVLNFFLTRRFAFSDR